MGSRAVKEQERITLRKQTFFLGIGLIIAISLLAACQKEASAKETAEQFINYIAEGEYEKAYEQVDEDMENSIEQSDLSYIWIALELSSGENKSLTYDKTEQDGEHEVVFIEGEFTEGNVTFMITINKDQEVAGFFVV